MAQIYVYIDDLVQDRSNSIANALELLQSFTKPSIYNSNLLIIIPTDVFVLKNARPSAVNMILFKTYLAIEDFEYAIADQMTFLKTANKTPENLAPVRV